MADLARPLPVIDSGPDAPSAGKKCKFCVAELRDDNWYPRLRWLVCKQCRTARVRAKTGAKACRPASERYWSKVTKTESCWLWTGQKHRRGYGRISIDGHKRLAHHIAWEELSGPLPAGLCLLHKCDNPPCVRPDHLFVGTRADNNADMKQKGRHRSNPPCGAAHWRAKLTPSKVRAARLAFSAGRSATTISKRLGVNRSTVEAAINRKTWRHVS